jgi:uncharacterized membrane protein
MNNHPLSRIGTFFILVACGLFILFFGSVFAGDVSILSLLLAIAALFAGFVFHRSAPHPEPKRFSGLRNARQRSRLRREENQSEKTEK